jgi:NAD+ synthase
MIVLFDLAKKYNALVVGTENKSENLLSYFTRFGDQASDIEPIEHLYKTQVYELAKHLGVPKEIIKQNPSAGLWANQTDEGEFGFTYAEADQVLYLAVEKHMSVEEITAQGYPNAEKILAWRERNLFKHKTPYTL